MSVIVVEHKRTFLFHDLSFTRLMNTGCAEEHKIK